MHPFNKKASMGHELPVRMRNTLWERLKKVGHHIWDMDNSTGEALPVRKVDEHATIDSTPQYQNGDSVLVFLSGRKLYAKVASIQDGIATIKNEEESLEVPVEWLKSAQEDEDDGVAQCKCDKCVCTSRTMEGVCRWCREGDHKKKSASFEKDAIIRKRDGKWVVLTHDGRKTLGTHSSKSDAEAQLSAIEISKHKSACVVGQTVPGQCLRCGNQNGAVVEEIEYKCSGCGAIIDDRAFKAVK